MARAKDAAAKAVAAAARRSFNSRAAVPVPFSARPFFVISFAAMFPALLATFFFACSAICGQRLSRLLGGITANFWRLCWAAALLAALTLVFYPASLRGETAGWYLLSGVIGFGLGDVALFLAYPLLGSRLTILILMSFAVFFGAAGDWLLLRTPLRWELALSIGVILSGLVLALHRPGEPWRWGRGFVFAVIAGWGQGFGAALSHLAQEKARAGGFEVAALSQTAQRAAGGLLVAAAAYAIVRAAKDRASHPDAAAAFPAAIPAQAAAPTGRKVVRKNMPFWLMGSVLFGPVFGVTAMQWALEVLRNSALVVAITATAPLMIIPLARWIEKEKASPRALAGTALAVAGVVMAAFLK